MSSGSGNNNEITIVIRADGSAAVQGINPVTTAVQQLNGAATGAASGVAGAAAGLGNLATGAIQTANTINNVTVNLRNVTKETENAKTGFLTFFRDLSTAANQGLEVANKVYAITGSIYDFAKSAAETEEAKRTFQVYAASYGQSSELILAASKRAVSGQVANNELIKSSMRAMQLDVTKDAETMAKLWEIAEAKADLTGGEIVETFNQIVEAIGKGQAKMLIDLNLIPESMSRASDAEGLMLKKTELLSTVLTQGAKDLGRLGDVGNTAADDFNRFEATMSDMAKELGAEMIPALQDLAKVATMAAKPLALIIEGWAKIASLPGRIARSAGELHGQTEAITNKVMLGLNPPDIDLYKDPIAREKYRQDYYEKLLNKQRNPNSYNSKMLKALIQRSEKDEQSALEEARKEREELAKKAAEEEKKRKKEAEEEARKNAKKAADEAERAAREAEQKRKERIDAYSKAATKSFIMDLETNPDYVRNGSAVMTDVGKPKALEAVIPVLNEATRAAGLFVNTITASDTALTKMASSAAADPLKWVRDLADTASAKLLPTLETAADYMQRMSDWQIPTISEKAIESVNAYASGLGAIAVGYEAMKGAANKVKSQMPQWKKDDENKAFDEAFEKAKQQADEFDRRMTISFADATEAGLADGFSRGGNAAEKFAKGFGENMLRQLSSALSYGLTQAIFSGGGGNIIGYLSGQNNVVATNGGFRAADLLNPVGAVQKYLSSGSSSSGSAANNVSGGLIGTLLKPMAKNGNLLWGNIGSNLATGAVAGFAVNRLFGSGGLFGSSVVHGQESIDQSADLNTQVTQAKELRDDIYKGIGITEQTRQALEDATFAYTWTSKHKSGNGITSKKTTTYQLEGSAAAQASIEKIKTLQKQAEGDQAWRQYAIAQAGQFSDIEPLKMALNDIDKLVSRMNASFTEAERADLLTQQMQAKSSLNTAIGTARNNAAGYILSNPLAADTLGAQALLRMANGDQALGTNGEMIRLMLPGIKQAGLAEYELQKQTLEAGDDPEKLAEVLQSRQSGMEKAIEAYEKMWKDAEAEANDQSLSVEENVAAFERLQEIQTTLLNAKLQSLQLDQQIEQLEKEKKEKRADDLLSSIFTTVGEMRDQGGKEVLIAFTDSPDGRARLDEWLSIIEGRDPETAAIIRKGFEAAQLPRLK